jgi:hypothetical protein
MSNVALLMQTCGQDKAGDSKLAWASKTLADERIPTRLVTDGAPAVKNVDALLAMQIAELHGEVIEALTSTLGLWNKRVLSDKKDKFMSVVKQLWEQIQFCDEMLCFAVDGLIRSSPVGGLLEVSEEDWDKAQATAHFATLRTSLEEFFCDDDQHLDIVDRMATLLQSLPSEICPKGEAATLADSLKDQAAVNSNSRLSVYNLSLAYADVTDYATWDPDAMTKEYMKQCKASFGKPTQVQACNFGVCASGIGMSRMCTYGLGNFPKVQRMCIVDFRGCPDCCSLQSSRCNADRVLFPVGSTRAIT